MTPITPPVPLFSFSKKSPGKNTERNASDYAATVVTMMPVMVVRSCLSRGYACGAGTNSNDCNSNRCKYLLHISISLLPVRNANPANGSIMCFKQPKAPAEPLYAI